MRLIDDDDDDKVLAIRPKNLQLAPRDATTLSVKELKSILQACAYEGTTAGMDKRDLQEAVAGLCSAERNAEILVEQARKQQPKTAAATTTTTRTTNPSPSFSKEQMETAADRMSSMDPSVLRQQAERAELEPESASDAGSDADSSCIRRAAPVKAFALPALTTMARAAPPVAVSALRHQSTGAEGQAERVKTPAALAPASITMTIRSSRAP